MARNKSHNRNVCFKLYASGKSISEISRATGINSKQLSRWKKQDAWDSLLKAQQETTNQDEVEDKIRKKILAALDDPEIKPGKWRDVQDGIARLERGSGKVKTDEKTELASLSDEELDQKIEELQRFIAKQPKQ